MGICPYEIGLSSRPADSPPGGQAIKGQPRAIIEVLRWVAMRRDVIAHIVLLTRDGCANTDILRTNLDAALQSLAWAPDYEILDLAILPDADVRRGYPTPTLLYANRDLFGLPEPRPPLPEPT